MKFTTFHTLLLAGGRSQGRKERERQKSSERRVVKVAEGAQCARGVENRGKIDALEAWQKRQNGDLQELKKDVKEVKEAIGKINIELVRGRPSWAVTALVTGLVSVCTGLIVFLVTKG